eukprot:COSAG01_NODE_13252_length_1612_cov_1.430932_3_plen_73_part_00
MNKCSADSAVLDGRGESAPPGDPRHPRMISTCQPNHAVEHQPRCVTAAWGKVHSAHSAESRRGAPAQNAYKP